MLADTTAKFHSGGASTGMADALDKDLEDLLDSTLDEFSDETQV